LRGRTEKVRWTTRVGMRVHALEGGLELEGKRRVGRVVAVPRKKGNEEDRKDAKIH